MKPNIPFFLLLTVVTLITSCRKDRFIQTGEGPSVIEIRTIDHFQKLDLSMAADVEVIVDSNPRIKNICPTKHYRFDGNQSQTKYTNY